MTPAMLPAMLILSAIALNPTPAFAKESCAQVTQKALKTADAWMDATLKQLDADQPESYHKTFFSDGFTATRSPGFRYLIDYAQQVQSKLTETDAQSARALKEASEQYALLEPQLIALEADEKTLREDEEREREKIPPAEYFKSTQYQAIRGRKREIHARKSQLWSKKAELNSILVGESMTLNNMRRRIGDEMIISTADAFNIQLWNTRYETGKPNHVPRMAVCTHPIAAGKASKDAPAEAFYVCAHIDLITGSLGYRLKLGYTNREAPKLLDFTPEDISGIFNPKKPSPFRTKLKNALRKHALESLDAACKDRRP